jgi:NADH-quinone oxidoreductase subunit H
MLAETNRAPFDLAEAESELVAAPSPSIRAWDSPLLHGRVHQHRRRLLRGDDPLLGGWHPGFFPLPANPWLASLVGFGAFCAKLYTLIFFVMMARWTYPRTQF